ncbi:DUF512 domain-containing protein [Desulfotomaculum copahuensis]|uniref:Fe-S oxidoreductase n=1 Tax=Desulfotomaculum copahuensis TaxID=1838280 RepID=A0A1B7LIK4_9FIRM|nr:DUF512 domain-containing protein [Desulfotomaculum copahuensis]OAT86408.1 Fe-S oxidoreductase [Desulfotomaculum copahuensis]
MAENGLAVSAVAPGGIAAELGVAPGDRVTEINGRPVNDIIDYRFLTGDEEITVTLVKPGGEEWLLEIEKDFDEGLGLEFAGGGLGATRRCQNRCLFCFVDQMPPGLRDTLYVKDDDFRLSFLQGNFITLTNLRSGELERIVRQRLSPLYISVHTTNPALREKMMRHPAAGKIMAQLRFLAENGIAVHTQVVLCPGLNDGAELDRTFAGLRALWPAVRSIALVPVGLTGHRRGLFALRTFTPPEAAAVLNRVRRWQEDCLARCGDPLVYASDEFYLTAGEPVPPVESYGEFPQTENGVGLTRLFLDEWAQAAKELPAALPDERVVSVATGMLGEKVLAPAVADLNRISGLQVRLHAVPNRLLGPTVTVAGLLSGGDLLKELSGRPTGRLLIIPDVMLRHDGRVFLDDLTVDDLSRRLGLPVAVAGGPRELAGLAVGG